MHINAPKYLFEMHVLFAMKKNSCVSFLQIFFSSVIMDTIHKSPICSEHNIEYLGH